MRANEAEILSSPTNGSMFRTEQAINESNTKQQSSFQDTETMTGVQARDSRPDVDLVSHPQSTGALTDTTALAAVMQSKINKDSSTLRVEDDQSAAALDQ